MKRETGINKNLPRSDYTPLWGHKMHPGQPPSPACGLFLKCPSSRVWRERDRQRSLTSPPRFPHMPQNRNPYQNLCILKACPCRPSFCPKQPVNLGQFFLFKLKLIIPLLENKMQKPAPGDCRNFHLLIHSHCLHCAMLRSPGNLPKEFWRIRIRAKEGFSFPSWTNEQASIQDKQP